MKIALIFVLLLSACGLSPTPNRIENNDQAPPNVDTRFTTDSEQNVVKNGGWFSNNFRRGKMLRSKINSGLTRDGRSITVIREDFEYPDGLMIDDAFGGPVTETGKATWGSESRGSLSHQPFCISVLVHRAYAPPTGLDNSFHDHGLATSFCDADGDGVFETRPGPTFGVPSWVK